MQVVAVLGAYSCKLLNKIAQYCMLKGLNPAKKLLTEVGWIVQEEKSLIFRKNNPDEKKCCF